MPKSINDYNVEARKGKDAAIKFIQSWQNEITMAGASLATELAGKKIDLTTYNVKREALNKQTKDMNECIQSLNRQLGR